MPLHGRGTAVRRLPGWDQNNDRAVNTLPLTDPINPANPYDLRQGVATGKLNANLYRIFPGFSSINQEENETNFNYNSLQAGFAWRTGTDLPRNSPTRVLMKSTK